LEGRTNGIAGGIRPEKDVVARDNVKVGRVIVEVSITPVPFVFAACIIFILIFVVILVLVSFFVRTFASVFDSRWFGLLASWIFVFGPLCF